MALPVYQSNSTAKTNATTATAYSASVPSGTAVGDLLLIYAIGAVSPAMVTSGYTTLTSGSQWAIFYKIAVLADVGGTFNVTLTDGSAANAGAAFCVRITVPTASPTIIYSVADNTSASASNTGITLDAHMYGLLLIADLFRFTNASNPSDSAFAIANSNPTWSGQVGTGYAPSSGNNTAFVHVVTANQTGAPGTSTGNVTLTRSSVTGAVNGAIGIIGIYDTPVVATALTSTSVVNAATFVRRMVRTALTSAATIGVAVGREVANTWTNVAKNTTTWINGTKH